MDCCQDSSSCNLAETYAALDMQCPVPVAMAEQKPVSASMAEQRKPTLSCAEIATTFRSGAPFHHKKLCATMAANGAVPSCCKSDAMDCCQDSSSCNLAETYAALDMQCPVPVAMAEQRKPKLSCAEVATKFHRAAPFHNKKLCEAMAANGAVPQCCTSNAMDCCHDASSCNLAETYAALDMQCSVSMAEQSKPKLSCAQVATQFHSGGPFHNKKLCAAMAANGALPPCCASDAMNCCQDASSCNLAETYVALDMSCPASLVRTSD